MADRAFLERMTRELAEQGKLIEAGWMSLRLMAVPLDAPPRQLEEMRNAFFAGAQHLWGSIMGGVLDPDAEPTEADLHRMDLISRELGAFIRDFELRHGVSKGRA